jgi:mRNA interferase HigB
VQFYAKHADSKEALETWFRVCKHSSWSNFNEVRKAYPTADVVGDDRMVFNIKGNNYRLIARFSFRFKTVQVKWIGTHGEYNSINVMEI